MVQIPSTPLMPSAGLFYLGLAVIVMLTVVSGQSDAAEGHDRLHAWYRSLRHPFTGIDCCNEKDCRPTITRRLANGSLEALVDGTFVKVPKEAILPQCSIDGRAHVCATSEKEVLCFIYCPES